MEHNIIYLLSADPLTIKLNEYGENTNWNYTLQVVDSLNCLRP